MAIKKEQKEYCAHNIVSMIVSDAVHYFPNISSDVFMNEFILSQTYKRLFDFKNGLWEKAPDYILNLYLEEKGLR